MKVLLAAILGALVFGGTAYGGTIATRSSGSYGMPGVTPSALGTDLSQFVFVCGTCNFTDDPNSNTLIVGLTSSVPAGTSFILDLPSSFDGTFGLFESNTTDGTCTQGFALCTPGTDASLASCISDLSTADSQFASTDVFTFTVPSSCPDPDLTFYFDLGSGTGTATLGSAAGKPPAAAPEPGTLSLIFLGLAMVGFARRRLLA